MDTVYGIRPSRRGSGQSCTSPASTTTLHCTPFGIEGQEYGSHQESEAAMIENHRQSVKRKDRANGAMHTDEVIAFVGNKVANRPT